MELIAVLVQNILFLLINNEKNIFSQIGIS